MIKLFNFLCLLAISPPLMAHGDASYKHSIYLEAYPDHISDIMADAIVWHDGTKMPISNGQENDATFFDKLDNASLVDQISMSYPSGPNYLNSVKKQNFDPGRLRNTTFFKKMYGGTEEEVRQNLVTIEWLPKSLKKRNPDGSTEVYKLLVTKVNGVSEKLKKISEELDNLSEIHKFLDNPGGTFNWRIIAGTSRLSPHSFGIAIDINVEYSDYWLWDYKKAQGIPMSTNIQEKNVNYTKMPLYRNYIPWKIVQIFEKYKFVWGGKWYHYDTMHFEYRPELFPASS